MRGLAFTLLLFLQGNFSLLRAGDAFFPEKIGDRHFLALIENSPFTRSLGLPGDLVLSGVAEVNGETVATLIDIMDGRSMAISRVPNHRGWKLVELERSDDLEVAKASVAVGNGEIIQVYYDKEKIQRASQLAAREARKRSLLIAVRVITLSTLPDWINEIKDPVEKGRAIAKFIESGGFDKAPYDAVKMALSQSDLQARGTVMSAAFGRLGGGVGGVQINAAVKHLNSLENGRDKDFAINGLAHGLVGKDPNSALKWANSVSNEGFRNVVVKNVTRRIEAQSSKSGRK